MNPYSKLLKRGDLSDVPLKQPDPWAGPRLQPAFLREALPGEMGSRVRGVKRPMVSHPDFESKSKSLSRELQRQYPTFTDRKKQFELLKKEMGQAGDYRLLPVSALQEPVEARSAPDRAFARGTDVYMADSFPQDRQFGTIAHELRHAIANNNGDRDPPNPIGNQAATVFDSFGNQFDHHPFDYEDSDMLRSLRDLRLKQETGRVPGWALANSPWLRGGRDGVLQPSDLMEYVGRISAGKK